MLQKPGLGLGSLFQPQHLPGSWWNLLGKATVNLISLVYKLGLIKSALPTESNERRHM